MAASMHQITEEEMELLANLHRKRKGLKRKSGLLNRPLTAGERAADLVAEIVGSWRFIAVQSLLLVFWIILNLVAWLHHWDPYPFILLNLVLSFQAAYTAPIIMMSQNRQAAIDRAEAGYDYEVNLKAELEIELLHQKIDLMREKEVARLIELVERLESRQTGAGR